MLSVTFKYDLMPVTPLGAYLLTAFALQAIVHRQQIAALLIHATRLYPACECHDAVQPSFSDGFSLPSLLDGAMLQPDRTAH